MQGLEVKLPLPPPLPLFLLSCASPRGLQAQLCKKRGRGGGSVSEWAQNSAGAPLSSPLSFFFYCFAHCLNSFPMSYLQHAVCNLHPLTACSWSPDAKHMGFANAASNSNSDWNNWICVLQCVLHSCWQLASAHIYHKNISKINATHHPKTSLLRLWHRGECCAIFQNRVFLAHDVHFCMFLMRLLVFKHHNCIGTLKK